MCVWSVRRVGSLWRVRVKTIVPHMCTDGSPGSQHSASSRSQSQSFGCSHDTLVEIFLLPGSGLPRAWRWTKPLSSLPPSPPSQAYCRWWKGEKHELPTNDEVEYFCDIESEPGEE